MPGPLPVGPASPVQEMGPEGPVLQILAGCVAFLRPVSSKFVVAVHGDRKVIVVACFAVLEVGCHVEELVIDVVGINWRKVRKGMALVKCPGCSSPGRRR